MSEISASKSGEIGVEKLMSNHVICENWTFRDIYWG